MIKKQFMGLFLSGTLVLVACGKEKQIFFEKQKVNDIEINIQSLKTSKIIDENDQKQKVLKISLNGKNVSADVRSFNAMLLTVKNKEGNTLKKYPSTSLGLTLLVGQKARGDAFYILEGNRPFKVVYQDLDYSKQKAEWTIDTLPKKDGI